MSDLSIYPTYSDEDRYIRDIESRIDSLEIRIIWVRIRFFFFWRKKKKTFFNGEDWDIEIRIYLFILVLFHLSCVNKEDCLNQCCEIYRIVLLLEIYQYGMLQGEN